MLLQAYDFLHLFDDYGCRLQLGGERPVGNITMGLELIRKRRGRRRTGSPRRSSRRRTARSSARPSRAPSGSTPERPAHTAVPVLRPQPRTACVGAYLRYFTFLDHDAIAALDAVTAAHPRNERGPARPRPGGDHARARRGRDGTGRGSGRRRVYARAGWRLWTVSLLLEVCAETPHLDHAGRTLDGEGLSIVDTLVESGLAGSKNQARTLVTQERWPSTTAGRKKPSRAWGARTCSRPLPRPAQGAGLPSRCFE